MHQTPFFLVFGKQPRLSVDISPGIPRVGRPADTRDNLQKSTFELSHRNPTERAGKQADRNRKLETAPPCSNLDRKCWFTKRIRTRRGWSQPKTAASLRSQLSPVMCIVRLTNDADTREVSVHLAHTKPSLPSSGNTTSTAIRETRGKVLEKPIPLPQLGHPDEARPKIESYLVDRAVRCKCGPGRKSLHNYKYRLRLRGCGPESDLEYRAEEILRCQ